MAKEESLWELLYFFLEDNECRRGVSFLHILENLSDSDDSVLRSIRNFMYKGSWNSWWWTFAGYVVLSKLGAFVCSLIRFMNTHPTAWKPFYSITTTGTWAEMLFNQRGTCSRVALVSDKHWTTILLQWIGVLSVKWSLFIWLIISSINDNSVFQMFACYFHNLVN